MNQKHLPHRHRICAMKPNYIAVYYIQVGWKSCFMYNCNFIDAHARQNKLHYYCVKHSKSISSYVFKSTKGERKRGTGCGATDREQRNVDCLLPSLWGDMFAILEMSSFIIQTATFIENKVLEAWNIIKDTSGRIQLTKSLWKNSAINITFCWQDHIQTSAITTWYRAQD